MEGHDTPTAMEERVARAKRLMQQRQLEKERVEQEKEKEKELERRALGKNLLDFKQKQVEGWGWVGYGWVGSGRKTDDMIRAALCYYRWRTS